MVRVGLAGTVDISGSGVVATVPFKAVGCPGQKSSLSLQVTTIGSSAGGVPAIEIVHGQIEIAGASSADSGQGKTTDSGQGREIRFSAGDWVSGRLELA